MGIRQLWSDASQKAVENLRLRENSVEYKVRYVGDNLGDVMKVTIVCLAAGLLGRTGAGIVLAQTDIEPLVGKVISESPLVGSLIVIIWLFLKHLTTQREDHRLVTDRSLDTQEKHIEALQENTMVCEGLKSTLNENTRAFDRLERTLSVSLKDKAKN